MVNWAEAAGAGMHELSIALSMVEQVTAELGKHGGGTVEAVYVRIGVLSGVDVEALRFAYEIARQDTELAGSRLEIEVVPLLVECPQCGAKRVTEMDSIQCTSCAGVAQKILEGRELEVRALEIAE